jgi:hypothetical protein
MTRQPAAIPPDTGADASDLSLSERRRRRSISRTLRARAIAAGNLNAAKHLAYSTVAIEDDVLDEMSKMVTLSPHLADARFAPLVEGACRCIVQLRAASAAIAAGDHSVSLTSYTVRLEAQLARSLTLLGLVPRPTALNTKANLAATEAMLKLYQPSPPVKPKENQ